MYKFILAICHRNSMRSSVSYFKLSI